MTARSLAKRRMAAVQAGRATVLALTPGVPAIRQVTILPRGGGICRIDYQPLVRPSCLPKSLYEPALSNGRLLSCFRCRI